jgi:hypothetical protein
MRGEESGPISWWSWRPGVKPGSALAVGSIVTLLALLLTVFGCISLAAGILDSFSPPLQVPGIVTGRSSGTPDSPPSLTIRAQPPDDLHSTTTSLVVSNATFQALHDHDQVLLLYTPRLHILYALSAAGERYPLPGASSADNPGGSIILLVLGLLMLPYPLLLASWGLRDLLIERYDRGKLGQLSARVVGLRATKPTRRDSAGLVPRGSRPWYGMALLPIDDPRQVLTFSVSEQAYQSVQEGMLVHITYSPYVRHIYSLEQMSE